MRQIRCKVIFQLVLDLVAALLSLSTLEDGGYVGVPANVIALIGSVTVVARLSPPPSAFTVLCVCNILALPLSIAQMALGIWRAATVEDWCCSREETDKGGVAALLYVLCVFFAAAACFRVSILFGSKGAMAARRAPFGTGAAVIPVGEPVPAAALPVGRPVVGVQVIAG